MIKWMRTEREEHEIQSCLKDMRVIFNSNNCVNMLVI
jgi:hypothetical protein